VRTDTICEDLQLPNSNKTISDSQNDVVDEAYIREKLLQETILQGLTRNNLGAWRTKSTKRSTKYYCGDEFDEDESNF